VTNAVSVTAPATPIATRRSNPLKACPSPVRARRQATR